MGRDGEGSTSSKLKNAAKKLFFFPCSSFCSSKTTTGVGRGGGSTSVSSRFIRITVIGIIVYSIPSVFLFCVESVTKIIDVDGI